MDIKNESTHVEPDFDHDKVIEVTEDQGELAELHTKVEDLNDQLLRALAENQNLRRRLQREVEEAHQYAIAKFAQSLLSVADNFERALSLISDELNANDHFKNFIVGIELTEKELAKVFEHHNIQKHVPMKEKFDHNLHQALFDVPNNDVESGTILQVVQSGYSLNDRLLRPAMVGVAKKQEE
jgi:molecular chaperone GrpE